jgi:AcrR family transcriptional regulator
MVSGEIPGPAAPRSPGRPRLYEPDAERDLILSAALDVLRRNRGEEATVADILQEAGLSTRAFYRHFQTKEDVIRALYERDAHSFGAHLKRRVDAAGNPDEALGVWVYEMLGLAYDRRRAERVAALSSPMVLRVVAGTRAEQLGSELLEEPLRSVVDEGRATGWFTTSRPDLDIRTIRAITLEATNWVRTGEVKLTRREAMDHVLRFSRAALRTPS